MHRRLLARYWRSYKQKLIEKLTILAVFTVVVYKNHLQTWLHLEYYMLQPVNILY